MGGTWAGVSVRATARFFFLDPIQRLVFFSGPPLQSVRFSGPAPPPVRNISIYRYAYFGRLGRFFALHSWELFFFCGLPLFSLFFSQTPLEAVHFFAPPPPETPARQPPVKNDPSLNSGTKIISQGTEHWRSSVGLFTHLLGLLMREVSIRTTLSVLLSYIILLMFGMCLDQRKAVTVKPWGDVTLSMAILRSLAILLHIRFARAISILREGCSARSTH